MKKKIIIFLLCVTMLAPFIPSGIASIPAAAANDYSEYKTENVTVPEGWDYVEVSTLNELKAAQERHGGAWDNDGQPMFIRLMADIEAMDRWVSRFSQACLFLGFYSTTVIDFNGHRIKCEINAEKNGDNHTWYGVQIELLFGVCPDFYLRLVDSVGGGGIRLTAFTDVDGPTTALMINGHSLHGSPLNATEAQVPYWKDGVKVYIDGGVYDMYTSNEKFCGVQAGPLFDSNGFARWGYSLTDVPYARSAVGLDCVFATINNGYFNTSYPPEKTGAAADMGQRFLSNLGLCDDHSARYLRINGGKFTGVGYSVYMYSNMSIYADDDKWMKKLDPLPVINGGEFHGGIQLCSTRTSFWKKLQGRYDLNPKMKDVKVNELLIPGAKVYMDDKPVDPNVKDLEDIAWPHKLVIEPGPQVKAADPLKKALAVNVNGNYRIQFNKAPDSLKLQEYITVIHHGQEQSYWTDAEGSYYILLPQLGANYFSFYIPSKSYAKTGVFRVSAQFGDITVLSDTFEIDWIDFTDCKFTYGPQVHDGNGAGVAYVDFDVSHRDAVTEYGLYWLVNGDNWRRVDDAPHLTQDYNDGKYRFYIPELADKKSASTDYCIIVTYSIGGVESKIYSDEFTLTEDDLGAPMDPYSVGLDCVECILDIGELKTIYVTLFPTATPHKEGFTVQSSDPGVVFLSGVEDGCFTITGNGEGTATVTVTAVGGAFAECLVTVNDFSKPGSFIPGDVNGDGEVDNKDVVTLFRYLSGTDVTVNTVALDTNGDSEVDNKDVVVLFRYLSGADVILSGKPYIPEQ